MSPTRGESPPLGWNKHLETHRREAIPVPLGLKHLLTFEKHVGSCGLSSWCYCAVPVRPRQELGWSSPEPSFHPASVPGLSDSALLKKGAESCILPPYLQQQGAAVLLGGRLDHRETPRESTDGHLFVVGT